MHTKTTDKEQSARTRGGMRGAAGSHRPPQDHTPLIPLFRPPARRAEGGEQGSGKNVERILPFVAHKRLYEGRQVPPRPPAPPLLAHPAHRRKARAPPRINHTIEHLPPQHRDKNITLRDHRSTAQKMMFKPGTSSRLRHRRPHTPVDPEAEEKDPAQPPYSPTHPHYPLSTSHHPRHTAAARTACDRNGSMACLCYFVVYLGAHQISKSITRH